MPRLPTYFLCHGGGPWPYVPSLRKKHAKLASALEFLSSQLTQKPKAIVIISAHWEESSFTVNTAAAPSMLYDYFNAPPQAYAVTYPAPGAPDVAAQVQNALVRAGLPTATTTDRGFDHGVFVPMSVVFPNAEIPIVQLSLHKSLNPALHLKAGRALSSLRDEGILIVASGQSYHNLRAMMGQPTPSDSSSSAAFDDYLQKALINNINQERSQALEEWETAPTARQAHPREEHLMPLMVAVGAAEGDAGKIIHSEEDFFGHFAVSSYQFG